MSDDQDGCQWVSVSSGTGSPGCSRTKGRETVVCVCVCVCVCHVLQYSPTAFGDGDGGDAGVSNSGLDACSWTSLCCEEDDSPTGSTDTASVTAARSEPSALTASKV